MKSIESYYVFCIDFICLQNTMKENAMTISHIRKYFRKKLVISCSCSKNFISVLTTCGGIYNQKKPEIIGF